LGEAPAAAVLAAAAFAAAALAAATLAAAAAHAAGMRNEDPSKARPGVLLLLLL
jgi:hypothetical protein